MKYLRLTLREPPEWRNPMHTFVMDHPEMERTQLLDWNTNDPAIDVFLFRVVGALDPYVAALEDAPFVLGYETARIDASSFYVCVEHETRDVDEQFRAPFLQQRTLIIPPIEFTEHGETLVSLVGRTDEVQVVVDEIPDEIDVEIDEVGDYDRGLSAHASVLTDRQFAAIEAAQEVGYYDVPREGSVEDVADALGCAPSTASNHLRKAESELIGQVVER